MKERLYSVDELMEIMPLSRSGITRAVKKDIIPVVRVGSRIFIPSWWVEEKLAKPTNVN